MRLTLVILLMLSAGCAGLQTFFADSKQQLDAVVAVVGAGTYELTYQVKKDGAVLLTQTLVYECTRDGTQLTGCHKQDPDAAVPVVE